MNYLTPDPSYAENLVKTEKLLTPVESMSLSDYLNHLKYLSTDELPDPSKVADIIAEKMNPIYSKVMMGGKFRIAEEKEGDLYFYEKGAFKDFNADLIVHAALNGTRKQLSAVDLFLKSALAKKYSDVVFNPAHVGDFANKKNLFTGFPEEPVQSDLINLADIKDPFDYETEFLPLVQEHYPACTRLIEHLHDNISDNNSLAFAQMLGWLSDIITKPEVCPSFAVIIRGEEKGTGKSTVGKLMREVIGAKYWFKAENANQLNGRFNSHIKDKLLVIGEEMSWGGNRDLANQLKEMITGDYHNVEFKGIDLIPMPKFYRMMLITNEEWVFNASKDERRALIFDVNPQQAQNNEYFAPFYTKKDTFNPEMVKQFRDMLASLDTASLNMMKPVETDGLKAQILESLSPMEQWWLDVIDRGGFSDLSPLGYSHYPVINPTFYNRIAKSEVHEDYLNWLDRNKPSSKERITNARAFGSKFVNMVGKRFVRTDQKVKVGEKQINAYEFHRPEEMVKHFNELY